MATISQRRYDARLRARADLLTLEGEQTFRGNSAFWRWYTCLPASVRLFTLRLSGA